MPTSFEAHLRSLALPNIKYWTLCFWLCCVIIYGCIKMTYCCRFKVEYAFIKVSSLWCGFVFPSPLFWFMGYLFGKIMKSSISLIEGDNLNEFLYCIMKSRHAYKVWSTAPMHDIKSYEKDWIAFVCMRAKSPVEFLN